MKINLLILFLWSLGASAFCQNEPNDEDIQAEIINKVRGFASAIQYVADSKISLQSRLYRIGVVRKYFTENAKIEVLPRPGANIIKCSVGEYFNRVKGYSEKYDIMVIDVLSVRFPKDYAEVIYKGQMARKYIVEYEQRTSFHSRVGANRNVNVEVDRPMKSEITKKNVEIICFQERKATGLSWHILLSGIKVQDGEYIK
jgi:hypothetical protein